MDVYPPSIDGSKLTFNKANSMEDAHMTLPPPIYEGYAIPEIYQVNETVQIWLANRWVESVVTLNLTDDRYNLRTSSGARMLAAPVLLQKPDDSWPLGIPPSIQ